MTPLFTSVVCDYCDGLKTAEFPYRGYVVWRGPVERNGREEYVFPTREDAERYRAAVDRLDAEIREVRSETEIQWHSGRGTIRDLQLADHVFTIYPDWRFEPGPYRAYLVPEENSRFAA